MTHQNVTALVLSIIMALIGFGIGSILWNHDDKMSRMELASKMGVTFFVLSLVCSALFF